MSEKRDRDWIAKRLNGKSIPFRNFMELALYDPEFGYYAHPRGGLDYATSVEISPVFAFALSQLAAEFVERSGDALCTIVDIGCGDGSLLSGIRENLPEPLRSRARFVGVDRSLGRLRPELAAGEAFRFVRAPNAIDLAGSTLVLSNELFDAFPVARLVQREAGLRELWVRPAADGSLDWEERDAPPEYVAYVSERRITLETGQYADITPGWGRFYEDLASRIARGLLVTIDYGFPQEKLFDVRVRRYGSAVAFRRHQLTRDLLVDAGEQDLTAHINFTDLQAAGERNGWRTLLLERQAKFLLRVGITRHPLLAPLDEIVGGGGDAVELAMEREAARRLVLPDGIGEEMRVLIQEKGGSHDTWTFERDPGLFPNVM